MLLYYISDRRQFRGSPAEQRAALLKKIFEAAHSGVDYIQLREKDLGARELLQLAHESRTAMAEGMASAIKTRSSQATTRLLINSRIDVALASGADGVHLRSDDISAGDARAVWSKACGDRRLATGGFLIGISCHTTEEVRRAASDGADFAVFAPLFEKGGKQGVGLEQLRAACLATPMANTPEASPAFDMAVLALGGVTLGNARSCLEAGAKGIAGIRLFQDNDVGEVVKRLRGMQR